MAEAEKTKQLLPMTRIPAETMLEMMVIIPGAAVVEDLLVVVRLAVVRPVVVRPVVLRMLVKVAIRWPTTDSVTKSLQTMVDREGRSRAVETPFPA